MFLDCFKMATVSSENTDSNTPKLDIPKYKSCKVLELLENKDKDRNNILVFGVLQALRNSKFMFTSYLDRSSQKIADEKVEKIMKDVSVRTPDINRQFIITWIKTYLDNTEIFDAGGKFDKFILNYG